ncbi:hypothetical protein BJ508DRAFT_334448 [Ascobolus immersus RN42]|uniref:Uncharacterized protein n=1 Tax=Ascobolus immersus RN42 TaxID=1160509 RepID=A0A3N4HKJ2_ASCIM|nr:hypothetical protein BJ508DRAFT_334448 [Ascobolus immersus RN42]
MNFTNTTNPTFGDTNFNTTHLQPFADYHPFSPEMATTMSDVDLKTMIHRKQEEVMGIIRSSKILLELFPIVKTWEASGFNPPMNPFGSFDVAATVFQAQLLALLDVHDICTREKRRRNADLLERMFLVDWTISLQRLFGDERIEEGEEVDDVEEFDFTDPADLNAIFHHSLQDLQDELIPVLTAEDLIQIQDYFWDTYLLYRSTIDELAALIIKDLETSPEPTAQNSFSGFFMYCVLIHDVMEKVDAISEELVMRRAVVDKGILCLSRLWVAKRREMWEKEKSDVLEICGRVGRVVENAGFYINM